MSGDRFLDECEREMLAIHNERQKGLRQFAEDVAWFAYDRLDVAAGIGAFPRQDKLLLMSQYLEENGYYEYGRWMATEKEKDDFLWEALGHMTEETMPKNELKKESVGSPLYRRKIQKFDEEMKFFCLDFELTDIRNERLNDDEKMKIMDLFNERVGLKHAKIWVENEGLFFKIYLDFLKKSGQKS